MKSRLPFVRTVLMCISAAAIDAPLAYGLAISFQGCTSGGRNHTSGLISFSSADGQIERGSPSSVLNASAHTITATVTDSGGKASTAAVSVTVQRFNNPPAVVITGPETGSSHISGATVLFTGAAIDAEDGDRTASIVWTSSLDGDLSTGGTVHKALSIGTHVITTTVTDSGGKSASDAITIVVQSPPTPALRVAVTADKTTYVNRNKVYITATVTVGSRPVPGAAIHLELMRPNGTRFSTETTTDANGIARFQYNINIKRDSAGTFTAMVATVTSGYNPGSGSTIFTVTR